MIYNYISHINIYINTRVYGYNNGYLKVQLDVQRDSYGRYAQHVFNPYIYTYAFYNGIVLHNPFVLCDFAGVVL